LGSKVEASIFLPRLIDYTVVQDFLIMDFSLCPRKGRIIYCPFGPYFSSLFFPAEIIERSSPKSRDIG
jgi:hypothetical protein